MTERRPLLEVIRELPGYDPYTHAEEGMRFDEGAAQAYIDFIENVCCHAKGAKAGTPFVLEDWQRAIVGNLFGWKRADGSRRYRECLIYVAKKNGKTTLESAIGLAVLCIDGEPACEVYSAAGSRDQAGLVFQQMQGMIRHSPDLKKRLRVFGGSGGAQVKSIAMKDDPLCFYRPLAADANTADGLNPHLNLVDELHRHKKPELAQVLHKSGASRRQPLTIYTTTADYARESLCNDMLRRAREVMANQGDASQPGLDPSFLPVVYEASSGDAIDAPETWAKANPNLGVTVSREFMETEARKALENPTDYNSFVRLHLNIVTDADEAWLPMEGWDLCRGEDGRTWQQLQDAMRGRRCYAGFDAAKTTDLTALALWFPSDRVMLCWFWLPRDTAVRQEGKDPKRLLYSTWAREGALTLTDGSEVDYSLLEQQIKRITSDYDVQQFGYDRYGIAQLMQRLGEQSAFEMIQMAQGHRTLGAGTKELESMVVAHSFDHGGHPVLRWNASNTTVRVDDNLNIVPHKRKSTGQIDGISASVMALSLAIIGADGAVDLDAIYASGDDLYA